MQVKIGAQIRALRRQHGMTQEELADIRATGRYAYHTPFLDAAYDEEKQITATPQLPELLELTLLDKNANPWKALHDDPRYLALIDRVKSEIKA